MCGAMPDKREFVLMTRIVFLALILSSCAGNDLFAQDQRPLDSMVVIDAPRAERPHEDSTDMNTLADTAAKASVCQIEADPGAYNHKLLEVTGFIETDWESFLLMDPACPDGTIFLEAAIDESQPLTIEDIVIPFLEDQAYRQYKEIANRTADRVVRATLLGRFFGGPAAKSECKPDGKLLCAPPLRHLPHLGVQKMLAVEPQDRGDLDYRIVSSPEPPRLQEGCGYRNMEDDNLARMIETQKRADDNGPNWMLNDPQRIATEELASLLKIQADSITMRVEATGQGRFVYEWTDKYRVVVSRPYLLTFYARDPMKIAWVVAAAYESGCGEGPWDVSVEPATRIPE